MDLSPKEIMERLSATWAPDAMQDPTTAERWVELFDPSVVLIEPPSLPHGGRHQGIDQFQSVQAGMRAVWDQTIESTDYWECASDLVALRIVIRWTAKATGRSVVLPMVDLIRFGGGKIVQIEAFVADTKALLDTLA
jgi:hypothetical protein